MSTTASEHKQPGARLLVVEDEPTVENRTYLAELLAEQGLFDDSAAIHLELVKAELKMHEEALR